MPLLTEYVYLFTYQEITGDNFKADTQKQGEYEERIRSIIKNDDPVLCREIYASTTEEKQSLTVSGALQKV